MKLNPAYFHYVALSGFFGLLTLLMLWQTVFAPSSRFPIAMLLLITVTPLLLPMRGLLARNLKSCAWAAYLSLFYFIHGAVEAYANAEERLFAVIEIALSLMLFFGCSLYIRYAGKAQ
ncbi:MAG: DUF2069 domain-containing protein [Gammaproteobacteria bacterium]